MALVDCAISIFFVVVSSPCTMFSTSASKLGTEMSDVLGDENLGPNTKKLAILSGIWLLDMFLTS